MEYIFIVLITSVNALGWYYVLRRVDAICDFWEAEMVIGSVLNFKPNSDDNTSSGTGKKR